MFPWRYAILLIISITGLQFSTTHNILKAVFGNKGNNSMSVIV